MRKGRSPILFPTAAISRNDCASKQSCCSHKNGRDWRASLGGIAHDFNNLLTIITSYSELALDSVAPGSSTQGRLQEILAAAHRAADLTRQLLAFSRKQPQALRVAELNPVVGGIVKGLCRLIGEDIELSFIAGEGLGKIRLDPVQIEQILMNLAANSRDAMPQGGRCTIETSNVELDQEYVDHKRAIIPIGRYALLTVTDTGRGIPAEHLSHVFEPFYTTKASGKGTGLGLATVYGIVKQNHGFVWVYSEPGIGTTLNLPPSCRTTHVQSTPQKLRRKICSAVQRLSYWLRMKTPCAGQRLNRSACVDTWFWKPETVLMLYPLPEIMQPQFTWRLLMSSCPRSAVDWARN